MAVVFHEDRLPVDIERGARGGPVFKTTVIELFSGFEQRNRDWSRTRAEWDISYGIQDEIALDIVIDFFYARQGRAFGFRFKDFTDFQITNGLIGLGDDSTTIFQIVKVHASGGFSFSRIITKIVASTFTVFLEGTPLVEGAGPGKFTIDINTGLVTLGTAPASTGGSGPGGEEEVRITTEFDVPVRFASDKLDVQAVVFSDDFKGILPAIMIRELR